MKPINNDVMMSRDDCIDLFRKHNCTQTRITDKLCSDLNSCIHSPDRSHCFIDLRDDYDEETELEGMQEMLENLALALGGTTIGAYFADFLRMRHHVKALFVGLLALLTGTFAKMRQKTKKLD